MTAGQPTITKGRRVPRMPRSDRPEPHPGRTPQQAADAPGISVHGRLDEAEFTRRLDRVMSAVTYQGLAGVLEDLPRPSSPALVAPARRVPPPARRDRRQRTALGQIIVLALFAILLVTVSHAVNWVLGPVLWICLLGLLIGSVIHRRLRR